MNSAAAQQSEAQFDDESKKNGAGVSQPSTTTGAESDKVTVVPLSEAGQTNTQSASNDNSGTGAGENSGDSINEALAELERKRIERHAQVEEEFRVEVLNARRKLQKKSQRSNQALDFLDGLRNKVIGTNMGVTDEMVDAAIEKLVVLAVKDGTIMPLLQRNGS
jgi:hypothetical protein